MKLNPYISANDTAQITVTNLASERFLLQAGRSLIMLQIDEATQDVKKAYPLKYVKILSASGAGKFVGAGNIGVGDHIWVSGNEVKITDKTDNGDGTYTYTDDSGTDYSGLAGSIVFNFNSNLLKVLAVAATDFELAEHQEVELPVYVSGAYIIDYSDYDIDTNQALIKAIKQNTQGITPVWLGR